MNADQLELYFRRQNQEMSSNLRLATQRSDGKPFPRRGIVAQLSRQALAFAADRTANPRWTVLTGLRGVGKTTVLYQLCLDLIDQLEANRHQARVLYLPVNEIVYDLNSTLGDALRVIRDQILASAGDDPDFRLFLTVDEAQLDSDWAQVLRIFYDRDPRVFLVVSGSSAIQLQLPADVAGRRAIVRELPPLSFGEFQSLAAGRPPTRGLGTAIDQGLYGCRQADEVYRCLSRLQPDVDDTWGRYDRRQLDQYLTVGSLPFVLGQPAATARQYLRQLTDRIITQDLLALGFSLRFGTQALVRRLLSALANSGDVISQQKLARLLDVSPNLVGEVLAILVKAGLLIRVPAGDGRLAASRNPARYLFMSPAFRQSYCQVGAGSDPPSARRGRLLEDLAGLHYHRDFVVPGRGFLSHPYGLLGGQADFVLLVEPRRRIVIEFGIGQKAGAQAVRTLKHCRGQYGLVFHGGELKLDQKRKLVFVPLDYFFLLGAEFPGEIEEADRD